MEMYKFLRQLRIERKLSQSELAEKLELKRSTISMYENGKRQPNIETLILISKIFDIDINILKKDNPNSTNQSSEIDLKNYLDNFLSLLDLPNLTYNGKRLKITAHEKIFICKSIELNKQFLEGITHINKKKT